MSGKSRWDYLKAIHVRYTKSIQAAAIPDSRGVLSGVQVQPQIRDSLAQWPSPQKPKTIVRQGRRWTYGATAISALSVIWEAAGYPCSARLKALLPLWLPWAIKRRALTAAVQKQLLTISPATIDRRLKGKKGQLKKRLYGRTKPGTLLKHHIPIKTDRWDVTAPGFTDERSIWCRTRATRLQGSSCTRSTSPTSTRPGWKAAQ